MQRRNGEDIPVAQTKNINHRRFAASFRLQEVTKTDQDLYRCVTQSERGSGVSNFAQLIVRGKVAFISWNSLSLLEQRQPCRYFDWFLNLALLVSSHQKVITYKNSANVLRENKTVVYLLHTVLSSVFCRKGSVFKSSHRASHIKHFIPYCHHLVCILILDLLSLLKIVAQILLLLFHRALWPWGLGWVPISMWTCKF